MNIAVPAVDIDLQNAPRVRGNAILNDLDLLRQSDPVFWSQASHCWILTRYQDVSDMMMGKFPLQNGGRESYIFSAIPQDEWAARIPNIVKQVPLWIVSTDDAKHVRLRALLMKAFNRKIVEAARETARVQANRLLDIAIPQGEIEFNENVARAMTGHVLFSLIGLPERIFPSLKDWATAIMEAFGGSTLPSAEPLERAERAAVGMNDAVVAELEKRKVEPKDDLLTSMLQATDAEGRHMTIDEITAQMHVIIIAGHDTSLNTMSLGVAALSQHPEAWQYMYEHPEDIANSVAEIQRYVAMSAGQAKIASQDFELHGKQIKQGDLVMGAIAAADRDPAKVDNPNTLDVTRENRDMMVFAPGPRSCIGHMLAKMQLQEFFSALVARVKSVEVLDPELNFMPVYVFRGLYNLNIRIHPR